MSEVICAWEIPAELGEGVFWHAAEKAVYWVDIIESNLHRLAQDGSRSSWYFEGHISAVVACETGGLLATFENGLSHIDPDTHAVTPLVALEEDQPRNRFNDGCGDTRGQFWFGSMDDRHQLRSGSFYCLNRKGVVKQLPSFGKICITNGPTFSADGEWVYYTDTLEGQIFRAPLDQSGSPGTSELHIDFSELPGNPDGMCTDTQGGLWVCHFGGSRITRFLLDGSVDRIVELPVPNITKCVFGGLNLQTLYITTAATGLSESERQRHPLSGSLFAAEVAYKGFAMPAIRRAVQF